jgi:AcrR family transcriptional regulator
VIPGADSPGRWPPVPQPNGARRYPRAAGRCSDRSRSFRRGDDRGRLLSAFVDAAARSGFESLTPAQITASAGLPGWTFYRYFDDTSDCLLVAYEEAGAWISAALADATAESDDWASAVAAAVAVVVELAAIDPPLSRLCGLGLRRLDSPVGHRLRSDLDHLAAVLRRGRERCPHGDRLPEPLELSALSAALGLLGAQARRGSLEPDQLARDITYFLLVPYLGQASALGFADRPRRPAPRG